MNADELEVVERWEVDGERGVGWRLADDPVDRTSHAVAVGEDDPSVWLCDPVDAPGLDDLLAEYGEVAGAVVQLSRHRRDAAGIARRHDVPVFLPSVLSGMAVDFDCKTRTFGGELDDTGFHAITVVDNPFWREAALFAPDRGTFVVPEAVGTGEFFRAGDERLGVHPVLRPFPPRRVLGDCRPDRVLVGHGEGVLEDAATALEEALRTARRNAPAVYLGALRQLVG